MQTLDTLNAILGEPRFRHQEFRILLHILLSPTGPHSLRRIGTAMGIRDHDSIAKHLKSLKARKVLRTVSARQGFAKTYAVNAPSEWQLATRTEKSEAAA